MAIVEHKKFILTDAANNNNKFWEYTWHDDGRCDIRFGRVGATGQTDSKNFTRKSLDTKIREKERKGYEEIKILAASTTSTSVKAATNATIKEAAMSQLAKGNSTLHALITKLVEANKHELHVASGGQMSVNLDTGMVTTALGVVTKENIAAARILLAGIADGVTNALYDSKEFMDNISKYLMLVPQKVGAKRGWHHDFIKNDTDLQRQNTMLDQLESSVDMAESRMNQAVIEENGGEAPKLFNSTLTLNTDPDVMKKITDLFLSTLNRGHSSRNLRPIRIYEVSHEGMEKAWENDGAKMKNIMRLWHGTRVFNVLSILKNGLIVPKSGGSYNITGRMFGDGLYFSDQSTKSLNYSQGYWDGGAKDNNCFMFLFDVAMGNYHVPSGSNSRLHQYGHDSIFAQPGKSGIQNNEMIVFRLGQCVPRYLIEFSDKV